MLFKYKGVTITGEVDKGYINAHSYKDAIKEVQKKVVFIEYIGERMNNPFLNKARDGIDKQLGTLQEKISDVSIKSFPKVNKAKDDKVSNASKLTLKEKFTGLFGRKNKNIERDILKTLREISLNDDLGEIFNKIRGSSDIVELDSFDFQVDQEIGRITSGVSNTDINTKPKLINTKVPPREPVTKKNDTVIDWSLIEEDTVEHGPSSKLKVKVQDIMLFTRELQIMISSGLTLVNALIILQGTAQTNLSKILSEIIDEVQSGNSFSKSLAMYPKQFDYSYVSLVSVGEQTGSLADTLTDILNILEQKENVRKNMKTAMIYPIILSIVLVGFLVLASLFFMPIFIEMFTEAEKDLPAITQFVFDVSNMFPYIVLGVVGFFLFIVVLRKFNKKFDRSVRKFTSRTVFKIPILKGIVLSNYMYSFSSTVGLMLKNGIRLKDTLTLASKTVNNVYIKSEIANASALMYQGMAFSEALRLQKHFDVILVNIIATGEETGSLSFVLGKISNFYEDDLDRKIKNLMTAIEPISMIVIGIIIAPVIIGIALPILDMSSGALL